MPLIELDIETLAAGGDGVGREAGGRVVFVARSAPGDRVRAELVEEHRHFARAELRELIRAGPDRVEPPCALFAAGTCGGCQWQHLTAAAQARAKHDLVAKALRHLIAAGLELRALLDPAPAYGWRRRARLHWRRPADGGPARIGYFERRSHRIADAPACPQLEPALERALRAVRAALAAELGGQGELHVALGHTGEVHVSLLGACPPRVAAGLVGVEGIAGVALARGPGGSAPRTGGVPRTGRARRTSRQAGGGQRGLLRFGAATIELERGLRGRADQFAQASHAGNAALCELVDTATSPRAGLRVLELYAGAGNLTRVLRRGAAELIAVDVGSPPKAAAGVTWRRGPAGAVAAELAAAGERFDLVVLDPPRTGAAEAIAPIAALAPARVVYVSCDPATLARDLAALAGHGYRAEWAQPLDLMPQTAHVEVVAALRRQEAVGEADRERPCDVDGTGPR